MKRPRIRVHKWQEPGDVRISAPPIAAVVVYPFRKLSMVLEPRHAAAIAGAPGAIETNAPMVAMFAPSNEELTKCLPGKILGLDDIRPASLRKATIEPVKVTPPIQVSQVRRVLKIFYETKKELTN
jgi:hypothetical protein